MKSQILTLAEVAKYLRCSTFTVYRLAQRGDLPGARVGNLWRFNLDEIEKWQEKGGSHHGKN